MLLDASKDGKWEKVFELLEKNPELVNVRSDAKLHEMPHLSNNVENKISQTCAGLVWKLFPHPVGVFGTLLGPPKTHICKKRVSLFLL